MSAKSILKKIICGVFAFGLMLGAYSSVAATPDCPDCPAEKDGSLFPGGSCKNCNKGTVSSADEDGSLFPGGSCTNCKARRVSDKKVRIVDGTKKSSCRSCPTPEFKTQNYVFAAPRYKAKDPNRNCCDLASFALTHVDFKLNGQEGYNPYSNHVGNYRFRIFGCRRATKKAILNHGRVIQKNMAFQEVFKKSADKCYKVMEIPGDVCLADTSVKLPEYVLTAEITNFFMNICDEYDWDKAAKTDKRNGTSEMTVTWRLLNLSQSKVFWKGVTTGYGEVENGTYEGEVKLAEAAFADAAARLSSLPGFEAQLKIRPSAEELAQERAYLVEFDAKYNPNKCNFAKEIEYTRSCDYAPQPQCPAMVAPVSPCGMAAPQACGCTQPACACPMMSCPLVQGKPKVEEFVDVKTEKTIVEKKTITTTRVETPAPVCQQICQPVCATCPMKCERKCKQSKCRKICTEVCEEGGINCKTTCREDCGELPPVEEKAGVEVEHKVIKPQVQEDSGVKETHRSYENCIDENGDVIADGSCTLVDDSWVDLDGYKVDSKLCIVDRPPYNELSPENMLKIRGSVVEITNAKGKKGMGLIISDSFVLTSAGLVNKLQNTYDIKTINGETLKAKAVRVNPSKNTALMHLEKPVTYTPLSLNLDLPAIDQEGFISLGLLGNEGETGKNYMDNSGKIYGYRYSDTLGTEIIVDTLVQKVSVGSVLIDKLGTVNGISNSAKQTEEGMDLFIPTETALRSVGLSICEKLYEKKSPWEKPVYKPVTEKILQETKAPEAMPAKKRK
jgi:hypothetical protein